MDRLYLDTETCGFHGPIVLIQYAIGDGEITLYEPWRKPVKETLNLIESICDHGIVAFNLSYDWFHICQLYTTLLELTKKKGKKNREPDINEYAFCESQARFGPCVKPNNTLDLMLHARKGPYQSLMGRKPITIRRVPTAL